jgi:shikimate dehydrogenase
MDRYAVIGNPIHHSLSPRIHGMFAAQTGEALRYEAILAPRDGFAATAGAFLGAGGRGLNVTLPFKLEAWRWVQTRSPRAERARAVNTIALRGPEQTFGDNTDGIGLLQDLSLNHGARIQGRSVLVLGAGGAVRGVLGPLLETGPRRLVIANRTKVRAEALRTEFADLGPVQACGLDELEGERFELIINGTSAGVTGEVPALPETALTPRGWCYDMFYAPQPTAFVRWGLAHGAEKALDGLGMLVEQAAEAFWIWRGVRPDTAPVLDALRAG